MADVQGGDVIGPVASALSDNECVLSVDEDEAGDPSQVMSSANQQLFLHLTVNL